MDIEKTISSVADELKSLFADKNGLTGFDDWDRLIGCVITLEKLASCFSALANNKGEGEVVENG